MKNNAAAATVMQVVLMIGEEMGFRVWRSEGLRLVSVEDEDDALIDENLNGEDEDGARKDREDTGFAKDERWRLMEKVRGW